MIYQSAYRISSEQQDRTLPEILQMFNSRWRFYCTLTPSEQRAYDRERFLPIAETRRILLTYLRTGRFPDEVPHHLHKTPHMQPTYRQPDLIG